MRIVTDALIRANVSKGITAKHRWKKTKTLQVAKTFLKHRKNANVLAESTPLLSAGMINMSSFLHFVLKTAKRKLPLHELSFAKATAPFSGILNTTNVYFTNSTVILRIVTVGVAPVVFIRSIT